MDAFDMAKNVMNDKEVAPKRFCENCGTELENELEKCPKCACVPGQIKKEQEAEYKLHCIKNFILKFGRIILDIDTCIWLGFIILPMIIFWLAFFGSFIPNNQGYFESAPFAPLWILLSIILPFVLLIMLVITKYFIYLLIDIRDLLKKIENNTKNEE